MTYSLGTPAVCDGDVERAAAWLRDEISFQSEQNATDPVETLQLAIAYPWDGAAEALVDQHVASRYDDGSTATLLGWFAEQELRLAWIAYTIHDGQVEKPRQYGGTFHADDAGWARHLHRHAAEHYFVRCIELAAPTVRAELEYGNQAEALAVETARSGCTAAAVVLAD